MLAVPLLLAQCSGALEECELPRTLPWYFGLAIAALWVGAVAGVVLLLKRRLVSRRGERRGSEQKAVPPAKGTDLDVW